jgi:hypothetical protein
MDSVITAVCVWAVVIAGVVSVIAVAIVVAASAWNLVQKLKKDAPEVSIPYASPVPSPVPSAVPCSTESKCTCGQVLETPIKSEMVKNKVVLVYQCKCGKVSKI